MTDVPITEPTDESEAAPEEGAEKSPAISKLRRPIFIGCGVMGGLMVLSIWSLVNKQPKAAAAQQEDARAEAPMYVPDREAPQQLAASAQEEAEATQNAQAAGVQASLTGSEGAGEAPRATPPAARVDKFEQRRMDLQREFELKAFEAELDQELTARLGGTRVKAVENARQATLRDAKSLGDDSLGAGSEGAEIAAMLGSTMSAMRSSGGMGAANGGVAAREIGSVLRGLSGQQGETGGDPTQHAEKLEFFANGGSHLQPGELEYEVQSPRTPYELLMGESIPCILMSKIISAVPGMIIARVTQDVYDSVTHQHLLVPQNATAVGFYNAQVTASNAARLQIVWVRLNFPNGEKLNLGSMPGSDAAGVAGLEDQIDRHIGARLGSALLASVFTVGVEVTAPRNGSWLGSAVHRGVGENAVNLGTEIAREIAKRPPTLTIRQGATFNINVNKDIAFKRPYGSAS